MQKQKVTLIALSAILGTSLAMGATTLRLKPVQVPPISVNAYYHTPEGVTFAGLDRDCNFNGDFAFAPVNKWLATEAESSLESASILWTYPISKNEYGVEKMATSTAKTFQFRVKDTGLFSAPVLKVESGTSNDSYTLAHDGIKYGEYGTWENFAVNYQPSRTNTIAQANEVLSTNDPNASAILNMAMAGSIFTDITVYGFGESFYYCGDFYLEAVNAIIYSEQSLTAADVAVKVFYREKTTVDYKNEIADLSTAELTSIGDNRYYVCFKCQEPVFVTSAMQVVVLPAEGKSSRFSPMIPLQKDYRASNMGTASLYSTFSFMGKKASLQCMDFFGTELTNDDDTSAGFLNHWAIGVKGSYKKPESGIENPVADEVEENPDAPVYNLSGAIVGTFKDLTRLPAGIYISEGKKILKH